ncbi:MAG: M56 family metallopeptidase [Clostridiales bacterium]|nr:M56 family metallopeptidase [Clostridiales bacterium]
MSDLFRTVLMMSMTADIVILVVLIARLVMKRLPKKYLYILWGIVGFRLLCPFSFSSRFSIFNIGPVRRSIVGAFEAPQEMMIVAVERGAQTAEAAGHAAQAATETAVSVTEHVSHAASSGAAAHAGILPVILAAVWISVAVIIASAVIVRYSKLRKSLKDATEVGPRIYADRSVDTPFVLGIVRPGIYLPEGLGQTEREYLLLHEKIHIKRGDTFYKAIGILCLALHWFNPLVWVAFTMFCRDMEMSCDEEVISTMGDQIKADYSMSLVSFARKDRGYRYIVAPIAFTGKLFGRSEVKMRINNVLTYKKSSKLIALLALVLAVAVGATCFFNAKTRAAEDDETETTVEAENSDVSEEETEAAESQEETTEAAAASEAEETEAAVEETAAEAEEASEAVADGNGIWKVVYIDLFGEDLIIPDLNGGFVDGSFPEGTVATVDNGLACYLVEGTPVVSDTYIRNYDDAFTSEEFDSFVSQLEAMGFTGDYELDNVYEGTRGDLCVIVENLPYPGYDYARISYWTMPEGGYHANEVCFLG